LRNAARAAFSPTRAASQPVLPLPKRGGPAAFRIGSAAGTNLSGRWHPNLGYTPPAHADDRGMRTLVPFGVVVAPLRRTSYRGRGSRLASVLALVAAIALLPAEGFARAHRPPRHQTGLASYYGREFSNQRTASGERFDPGLLTAAHRTLPF